MVFHFCSSLDDVGHSPHSLGFLSDEWFLDSIRNGNEWYADCPISTGIIADVLKDYSVLMMAIHSALQVYSPSTDTHSAGLSPYRYYVYAGALIFPSIMSALAFVNPEWGYMSQGAFCTLPLRPYWYRLALAWIPRYLIAIIIVGLAVSIYTHVGLEFREFTRAIQTNRNSRTDGLPDHLAGDMENGSLFLPGSTADRSTLSGRRGSSVAEDTREPSISIRRASIGVIFPEPLSPLRESREEPSEKRERSGSASLVDFLKRHGPRNSIPDPGILRHTSLSSVFHPRRDTSVRNGSTSTMEDHHAPTQQGEQRYMVNRRAQIHRHLRLMFIYPLVYVFMWILPFVNHCMQYSDYWTVHPVYAVVILATLCVTSMGTVDTLIFSVREKPWRHIPNSDRSFLGSFCFWKDSGSWVDRENTGHRQRDSVGEAASEAGGQQGGGMAFLARKSRQLRMSGSSDRERDDAAAARLRLRFEMKDRLKANEDKKEDNKEDETKGKNKGKERDLVMSGGNGCGDDGERWSPVESRQEVGRESSGVLSVRGVGQEGNISLLVGRVGVV